MALKVYTCQEAASGPKTFLNIFCKLLHKMNLPQPDSGPDSNINSPYCTYITEIEKINWKSVRLKATIFNSNLSLYVKKTFLPIAPDRR
jgi:hypothetical protein